MNLICPHLETFPLQIYYNVLCKPVSMVFETVATIIEQQFKFVVLYLWRPYTVHP